VPPSLRRFLAALFWFLATSAAAFAGGAVLLLACSQDVKALRVPNLHMLVLLPSIFLYFLLDCWRPNSPARWIGFALPFLAAACLLLAVVDILPLPVNGQSLASQAVMLAGSLGGALLVIRAKCRTDKLGMPRFQFSLASLFVLVTLAALLCAAMKTFGPTPGGFMFGWAIAAVLLAIAFQGTETIPRGGWPSACSLAAVAVYGPFVAMFVNTLLFTTCSHCRSVWLQLLWVAPGGMIEILSSFLLFRGRSNLPPFFAIAIAGLLSAGLLATTACLARKVPLVRWIALAAIALLAAIGASAADALVRA
jgi:hypothetical protein